MNKLYSQIASLLVIVGLGTAWAFNVINETSFGTILLALLSAIYALYQKYEQSVLKTKALELEDKLESANKYATIQTNAIRNLSAKLLNTEAAAELGTSITSAEVVEKPKRKYYKSKKS